MQYIDQLSEYVKHQRKKLGLSQNDLAMRMDNKKDRQYINKLETKKLKGVTLETVSQLMTALNSEIKFLER
jgi:transcriptional regulator with XRE-family HTH domain